MDSLFVTGTDTDVGKTYVAAGLAAAARMMGADVGVMKPFAAGSAGRGRYASDDAGILSEAAGSDDPESLVNPQFFPIPASPYTAWKRLKTRPRVRTVLSRFRRLQKMHQVVVVEGMGGVMTPILGDYYVADLIRDMGIPAVVVAGSRIGTVNHTVMTCHACRERGIPLRGIVINAFGGGYRAADLARDLEGLTGERVVGTIPAIRDLGGPSLYRAFRRNVDLEALLGARIRSPGS